MKSINPATGQIIKEYQEHTLEQVEQIVSLVALEQKEWKKTTFTSRASLMRAAAAHIRENSQEYAVIATQEMGKLLVEAKAELEKCALVLEYYADGAQSMLAPENIKTKNKKSYVRFDPLGVVLAVMPWNFPFWQVMRFAAPALMAGNACALKHASNVPGCALAIEKIFKESGFPENIFRALMVGAGAVEALIKNPQVAAVTLTGSEKAGSSVGGSAGKELKKCVLELGGSDPFIVLADADIALAAKGAVKGRMINMGQSCIAAKRFIAHESIADEFEKALVEEFKNLALGDPMDLATTVGPLAREDLLTELDNQVQRSLKQGAQALIGGKRVNRAGAYYEPTIMSVTDPKAAVFSEETFGPVAAIIRARDEEHALLMANNSLYGLGASIWTKDIERAEAMAEKIEAGAVFINSIVKSDPRLPFGGIKRSGFGRELSHYGIKEFVNIKTVVVG